MTSVIGVSPPPPKANSLSLSYRKHMIQMNLRNNKKHRSINSPPKMSTRLNTNTSREKINIHVNKVDDDEKIPSNLPTLGMVVLTFDNGSFFVPFFILAQNM